MIALWAAVIALVVVFAVLIVRRRRVPKASRSLPAPPRQQAHPAAAPRVAPSHAAAVVSTPAPVAVPAESGFEWDEPLIDMTRKAAASAHTDDLPRAEQRAKLRDRYLAARFPGVARTVGDLAETERVIQSARLYFEDRNLDRAIELLSLAIRECPGEQALALARLEITFLMRSAALYVESASDFHRAPSAWTSRRHAR